MKKARSFSVVMATYTGTDTIQDTFRSLLNQKLPTGINYEVIVVIDGPNEDLQIEVAKAKSTFDERQVPFKITQFKQNKGRFEARLNGCRQARFDYILIMDDRIQLPDNYVKSVIDLGEDSVMPDVQESSPENFISLTLAKLRRKIYGEKWGRKFDPFYIDNDNFDKTAKGTAAFWVGRQSYLDAAQKMKVSGKHSKNSSDDTRLLKLLVESGTKIYKTDLRITYRARCSAVAESMHIFQRGPKFVDYYFRPGTRYFPELIAYYVLIIPVIAMLVYLPVVIVLAFIISVLLSIWLCDGLKESYKVLAGLWAVSLLFGISLVFGIIIKVAEPR